jgi:sulfide:quinone oxidoreductase
LAEFGYNGPLETFPFNQAHERRSMFQLKKRVMSPLYWHALLNGYWEGPRIYRKLMHGGFSE